jgi:hypothetical protein
MPIFKFPYKSIDTELLVNSGPIMPVVIALPAAREQFLRKVGIKVPEPVRGMAIIDTGAFATAIDTRVFRKLGIPAFDQLQTSTASGRGLSDVFPARISLPALGNIDLPMERIVGCRLHWQDKSDSEVLMLLGRDLLKNFWMVYDGVHSELTLGF